MWFFYKMENMGSWKEILEIQMPCHLMCHAQEIRIILEVMESHWEFKQGISMTRLVFYKGHAGSSGVRGKWKAN